MNGITVPSNFFLICQMIEEDGEKFYPANPDQLMEVTNKRFNSLEEVYDFLQEPDELIKVVYGEPDEAGLYTFPLMEEPYSDRAKYPSLCRGHLGDQTSYWHHETLKEHAAIVTYNLAAAGLRAEMAAALGVFHDAGKKYAAETNPNSEIWFADHEYLSTLLVGRWTKHWKGVPEADKQLWVATCYGHMKYYEWTNGKAKAAKSEKKFIDEVSKVFGNEAALKSFGLCNLLGAADECIRPGAIIPRGKVEKGQDIIRSVFKEML